MPDIAFSRCPPPVYGGVLAGLLAVGEYRRLAGGLFLLWQKAIRWHIPVSFLVSLGLCATLGWIFRRRAGLTADAFALRATMLGAFYPDRSGDGLNNQPRPSILAPSLACWSGSSAASVVIRTAWRLPFCWRILPCR